MYLAKFQAAGRALAAAGLAAGSSGNLSLRQADKLIITRSGSSLASLNEQDLVVTGLQEDYITTNPPSSELAVHRAVYLAGCADAVVHAHLPWALSLADMDSAMPGGVVVVGGGGVIIPGAFASEIAAALVGGNLVIVRGHGSFASASSMAEACRLTLEFENICRRAGIAAGIQPVQAKE
jgi:L-fuculose-phosphate aldolase